MSTLIVTMGIPGSGKSTWAENYVKEHPDTLYLSSDAIRKELYGDESIQKGAQKVFDLLNKRKVEGLKEGKDVLCDATNVTKRNRFSILSRIPSSTHTKCVIIATDPAVCLERQGKRERKVPQDVIMRMAKTMELPVPGEFDEVEVMVDKENKRSLEDYRQMSKGRKVSEDVSETLYDHMRSSELSASLAGEPERIVKASAFHDIGKMFCEPDKGKYPGHESLSAYLALCSGEATFDEAFLIEHHSDLQNMSMEKLSSLYGKEIADDLQKIDQYNNQPSPAFTHPVSVNEWLKMGSEQVKFFSKDEGVEVER